MPSKIPGRSGPIYEVKADPTRSRWIVMRDGSPTGGFGPNIHQGVNAAIAEAKQEARGKIIRIRVFSVVGVKRTEEWSSQ